MCWLRRVPRFVLCVGCYGLDDRRRTMCWLTTGGRTLCGLSFFDSGPCFVLFVGCYKLTVGPIVGGRWGGRTLCGLSSFDSGLCFVLFVGCYRLTVGLFVSCRRGGRTLCGLPFSPGSTFRDHVYFSFLCGISNSQVSVLSVWSTRPWGPPRS